MRFWLVNGTLHTAVSPEPLRADLLVDDGRIAAIGSAPAGETAVDCSGMQIFPGLVEAHCHTGLHGYAVGYEGRDYNEFNEPVSCDLRAIDAFNPFDRVLERARRAGVTCVCTGPGSSNVLGGTFVAVKTVGSCVDDMVVKEAAAMKCAFGENPKKRYKEKSISSRMTTAAKLRGALAKARDYMRKLEEAGMDGKRPDFDPRCEALLPVLRGELPLKAHAHQANDLMTAIRIAREFGVKLTLEHCTEGHLVAEEIARAGFPVAVGPTMTAASKPELANKSFATPGVLDRAGCRVSIITDAPVIQQEYLALCAALAVKAGMDPYHALQAITINPARHIGIADRVGSLEVGKDADLVVADGDILDPMSNVKAVYIDGEAVL